jgi:uncharacterized protein YeaO (DUF488 family)
MAVRLVRLGSERAADEGLRIGTVRRRPRGIQRSEFASMKLYDVCLPNFAPSPETMKLGQTAVTPAQWTAFSRKCHAEMSAPDNVHILELLAEFSHHSNLSVGCYCQDEAHCHRSLLRDLLAENGADLK